MFLFFEQFVQTFNEYHYVKTFPGRNFKVLFFFFFFPSFQILIKYKIEIFNT